MAQFDVYENPNPETSREIPYLLDVQSDLLDTLSTRVVVPLIAAAHAGESVRYLTPEFTVNKTSVLMSTPELAGIPIKSIGEKIGTLKAQGNEIIAALDFLFTGF